jgi:hypothetical protein
MIKSRGEPYLARLAALATIAAALGWLPADAAAAHRRDAAQTAVAQSSGARGMDLEELFWLCDYAATNGRVDATDRAACGAVTDELKLERFGGDSEQLLQWWRANKTVRHQQIERDGDAPAPE